MAQVNFRDLTTGQWRKAASYEKNKYFTIDTLSRGMASFTFKTAHQMAKYANEFADELVHYAQTNAPWSDRTGDARAGLQSAVVLENGLLTIDLYHTVSYGIWLEVRWGGRYAVIIPTIETMGPQLYKKFQGTLRKIKYYE